MRLSPSFGATPVGIDVLSEIKNDALTELVNIVGQAHRARGVSD